MRILVTLLVSCLLLESSQLQAQEAGTYYPSRRFTFDVTPRPKAAPHAMILQPRGAQSPENLSLSRPRVI